MIQIGVIGSGLQLSKEISKIAEEVGEELAKNNLIIVCGGKGGVMEAVCKGAAKYDGITVGILPSIDPTEANDYVKIKIPTNLGEDRNYIIIQSVQAVICISGAIGTRMEAEYTLKRTVPLITIPRTGGTAREITEEHPNKVIAAESARDAVKKLIDTLF
jgi:uncharacterized protein (TIGR00725 family)